VLTVAGIGTLGCDIAGAGDVVVRSEGAGGEAGQCQDRGQIRLFRAGYVGEFTPATRYSRIRRLLKLAFRSLKGA